MNSPRELLTAAAIESLEGQLRTHSLNPNAVREIKSLGDAVGLTQIGVHMMTIMPGRDSTEYHHHLYEEEFVYVLSGHGEALIDGTSHAVAAGDFLGFPRGGVAHGMTNTGNAPLVCLVAGQRLEQDVCDYPRRNKRLYVRGSEEDLVDLDNIDCRHPTPSATETPVQPADRSDA